MARAMLALLALLMTPLVGAADLSGTITHYAPNGDPVHTESATLVLDGADWRILAASGTYACADGDADYRPTGGDRVAVGWGVDNCAATQASDAWTTSWELRGVDLVVAGVPAKVAPMRVTGTFSN